MKWKSGINKFFGALAGKTTCYPLWFMIVGLISTLIPAVLLVNIKIDASVEGYMPPKAAAMVSYAKLRDLFGQDLTLVVSVESERIRKTTAMLLCKPPANTVTTPT